MGKVYRLGQKLLRERYGRDIVEIQDPMIDMKLLLVGQRIDTVVVAGGKGAGTVDQMTTILPTGTVYVFDASTPGVQHSGPRLPGSGMVMPVHAELAGTTTPRPARGTKAKQTSKARRTPRSTENGAAFTEASPYRIGLDRWMAGEGIKAVDLLLLREPRTEQLKGADKALRSSVRIVFIRVRFSRAEEHLPLFREIDGYLDPLGFELFRFYRCTFAGDRRLTAADAMFVHPGRVSL